MVDSRQRRNLNAAPPAGPCCLRTGRTAALRREPSGTDERERFWDVPVAGKRSSVSSCVGGGGASCQMQFSLARPQSHPGTLTPVWLLTKGPFLPLFLSPVLLSQSHN